MAMLGASQGRKSAKREAMTLSLGARNLQCAAADAAHYENGDMRKSLTGRSWNSGDYGTWTVKTQYNTDTTKNSIFKKYELLRIGFGQPYCAR